MLFDHAQDDHLRSCVAMIDEVLASMRRPHARHDAGHGLPAWRVQQGSAQVYILIVKPVRPAEAPPALAENQAFFLRIVAPILHADGVADQTRLFRRLLELNADALTGAAFAMRAHDVVLTAERATIDLERDEVLDLVQRVLVYADHWDDILHREFGGRMAGLSSAPIEK